MFINKGRLLGLRVTRNIKCRTQILGHDILRYVSKFLHSEPNKQFFIDKKTHRENILTRTIYFVYSTLMGYGFIFCNEKEMIWKERDDVTLIFDTEGHNSNACRIIWAWKTTHFAVPHPSPTHYCVEI